MLKAIERRKQSRRRFVRRASALVLTASSCWVRADPPAYKIEAIGITDPDHTNAAGNQDSRFTSLSANGQVAGYSLRYNGATQVSTDPWVYYNGVLTLVGVPLAAPLDFGFGNLVYKQDDQGRVYGSYSSPTVRSTWVYANGVTTPIGIGNGSLIHAINAQGQAIGYSATAWLYSNGTTVALGQTGGLYTRSDGYQSSTVDAINSSGIVLGDSEQFASSPPSIAYASWIYSNGVITPIGLLDARHTSPAGLQDSQAFLINNSGQVAGSSTSYDGSTANGQNAWFYSGGVTTQIDLHDAKHTSILGDQKSSTRFLNDAGQVLGYSSRFAASGLDLGQTAWLYSQGSTTPIGLIDSQHTRADGYQSSSSVFLGSAGQVVGTSNRYLGSSGIGQNAWMYINGNTVPIGFVDARHTGSSGTQASSIVLLTSGGHAAGYSEQYAAGNDLGQNAWTSDGTTTTQIGLTDTLHTRADGYQFSTIGVANSVGQITGSSNRYPGQYGGGGNSAWLYDPALGRTMPFAYSVYQGFSNTHITSLADDGTVLGTFNNSNDPALPSGFIAFRWKMGDGMFELGELIPGGLQANGWSVLQTPGAVNSAGQIAGQGLRTSKSQNLTFLMTPAIGRWAGSDSSDMNWNTPENWSDHFLPQGGAVLNFTGQAAKAISFSNDASLQAINVIGGDLTWNLNSHSLSLGGQLRVGDSVSTPSTVLHLNGGTVAAADGVNVFENATLKGNGTLLGQLVVASGGTIAPGNSPGVLHAFNVTLAPGSNLAIELAGSAPGQADQLDVTGTVTLAGANLYLSLLDGFNPPPNFPFVIVNNDGIDAVAGRFANLTDSGHGWDYFYQNGTEFRIDYNGGDGNDVSLTAIPEPRGIWPIAFTGALLLRRRNRSGAAVKISLS